MSDILVKISSIDGEATKSGFEKQIECQTMRHAIDLPVVTHGSTRTEGTSQHGAIELRHKLDKASPALRHACAAGANLGTVTISRMQMVGGENRLAETIELGDVYVSRVDTETPVDPAEQAPVEEPEEVFALDYSNIKWSYRQYSDGAEAGTVSGGWSNTLQTVNF